MKLKTKFQDKDFELGETAEVSISSLINNKLDKTIKVYAMSLKNGTYYSYFYDSIKEFTDHWEDASEKPKGMQWVEVSDDNDGRVVIQYSNEEEAEEAVRKLKAWTRINKDLEYLSWQREYDGEFSIWGKFRSNSVLSDNVILDNRAADLDLIFGDEE